MAQQGTKSPQQQITGKGATPASDGSSKKAWSKPKLKFVKPKLTKHGGMKEVTGQFFGAFSAQ